MATPDPGKHPTEQEMPFLSHLVELRDRLLRAVLVVLLIFLGLFYFANDLYTLLAAPLMNVLPQGNSMVAIDVASSFLTPLKLALVLSIFLAMPYLLYQVWAFVAPGLYRHEQRLVLPLMVSSTLLFFAGMAFAYYLVFPLIFGFFVSVLPQGVEMATDIGRYLDFVLKLFFAFGLAFETPVFIVLLVWTGMTTPDSLAQKRPYVIVGIFTIAMFLTPPDVFSQVLLAVPMWLLFEGGIQVSRLILKRKAEAENAAADEYRPLTEEEMDEELARLEAEEEAARKAARDK